MDKTKFPTVISRAKNTVSVRSGHRISETEKKLHF